MKSIENTISLNDFRKLNVDSEELGYTYPQIICLKNGNINKNLEWHKFVSLYGLYKAKSVYNKETGEKVSERQTNFTEDELLRSIKPIDVTFDSFKKHLGVYDGIINWNPTINDITIDSFNNTPNKPELSDINATKEFCKVWAEINGVTALKYYINFISQILQQPENKLPKAIMSIGSEGTGKSILLKVVKNILGDYYKMCSDSLENNSSTFFLRNALLVGFEEICSDRYDTGKMFKTFISDDTFTYKEKYRVPVTERNLSRVIINSNRGATNIQGAGRRWYVITNRVSSYTAQQLWADWFDKYDLKSVTRVFEWFCKKYNFDSNFIRKASGNLIEQQANQATPKQQEILQYIEDNGEGDYSLLDLTTTYNGTKNRRELHNILGLTTLANTASFFGYKITYNRRRKCQYTIEKDYTNDEDVKYSNINLIVEDVDLLSTITNNTPNNDDMTFDNAIADIDNTPIVKEVEDTYTPIDDTLELKFEDNPIEQIPADWEIKEDNVFGFDCDDLPVADGITYDNQYATQPTNNNNAEFETLNPVEGGRKNIDCTSLKNYLIEVDDLNVNTDDENELYNAHFNAYIKDLIYNGEINRVVYSGNKSFHCRVTLPYEAESIEEYKFNFNKIADIIKEKYNINIDRQCNNPARLTRKPNGIRSNGKVQHLYYKTFNVSKWDFREEYKQYKQQKANELKLRQLSAIKYNDTNDNTLNSKQNNVNNFLRELGTQTTSRHTFIKNNINRYLPQMRDLHRAGLFNFDQFLEVTKSIGLDDKFNHIRNIVES